jgi:non-specific serine/threonine protein kinase
LTRKEQGKYAEASALLAEGLDLFRSVSDTRSVADALDNLANLARSTGNLATAADLARQALEIFEALEDKPGSIEALLQSGLVALARGDVDTAESVLQRGFTLAREVDDKWGMAGCQNGLARVQLARGDVREAARLGREAAQLSASVDDSPGLISAVETLATIAARGGQPRKAARLLAATGAARTRIGLVIPPAERGSIQDSLRVAERALSSAAFAQASREGAGLGFEAAASMALEPDSTELLAERVPRRVPGDPLSPREHEVAVLIARGLTNRQIAEALAITEGTAGLHVVHILNKLGLDNRSQIAFWAVDRGLIASSPGRPD